MSAFSMTCRWSCGLLPSAVRCRFTSAILQQRCFGAISLPRVPALTDLGVPNHRHHHHLHHHHQDLLKRRLHLTPFLLSKNPGALSQAEREELVPERLYSRVVIKVKGADFRVLDSYCRYVITAAKALGINIGKKVALPMRIQKFTVLKSVHIYKKHRVQYEVRTHMRMMQIWEITGTTADVFLEYIQRNLPEGVSMTINQEKMDTLPALLTGPPEGEEVKEEDKNKNVLPSNSKKWKK